MELDKFCAALGELGFAPLIATKRFLLDVAPIALATPESELDSLVGIVAQQYPTCKAKLMPLPANRSAWYYSQPLFWKNLYQYAHDRGYVDFVHGGASNVHWVEIQLGCKVGRATQDRETCEGLVKRAMDARWGKA